MLIDTSALLAIFLAEAERTTFLDLILQAGKRLISAANVLETGIVLETRRGESAGREFDLFVVRTNLEIVPVDAEQIEIARSAWSSFGKGRHPAPPTSHPHPRLTAPASTRPPSLLRNRSRCPCTFCRLDGSSALP